MRVRYTVPAGVGLEDLLDSLASVSPQGARRVAVRIKDVERILAQFPKAGTVTRLPWLRRMKVPAFPCLVFYEVTDDAVLIHAVRHAARKPLDEQVPT